MNIIEEYSNTFSHLCDSCAICDYVTTGLATQKSGNDLQIGLQGHYVRGHMGHIGHIA